MDGNQTVEHRLRDLEERIKAQSLALYTVIWTISRIAPDAAERIRDSLDRMNGHLKLETRHATVLDEFEKLQRALERGLDGWHQGQG